jgi:hypothetical protein
MSQHGMANPQTLGAQYQLGNHKATYRTPFIIQGIVGLGLAIIFFVLKMGSSPSNYLNIFLILSKMPDILISPIFALFSLNLIFKGYTYRAMRVLVYEYGLVHTRYTPPLVIHWQNVESFFHEVEHSQENGKTAIRYKYIILCIDGLYFDSDMSKALINWKFIEEEISSYLFPILLNTYERSQTVPFGPLRVTPQGLYCETNYLPHKLSGKEDMLPWNEIKRVHVDKKEGHLIIKKRGQRSKWVSIPLRKIPNVEVLKMFICHIPSAGNIDITEAAASSPWLKPWGE